jgi:hypothetical protein
MEHLEALLVYSVNDYYGGTVFKFNKQGFNGFAAGVVGNVLSGGLFNRFNVLTGLGNDATIAAKSILISVDAANNTWGNVIANQIEAGLNKVNK